MHSRPCKESRRGFLFLFIYQNLSFYLTFSPILVIIKGGYFLTAEDSKMKKTPAYVKALSLLAISDMSERKLREKLRTKGFSLEEISEALEELKGEGYLSDDRLMENLVNYYAKRKYFGKYRIKLELLSKFDRESVDRCFDTVCECIDFRALACEYALKEAEKGVERDRLVRKLQRLGHDASTIRYALSEIKNQESQDI